MAETIDPVVERRTMLKMDTVVLGCFGVMYLLANLDRNNLGATNIMGLPEDLNLQGNQFGNAVTLFYATYVAFETPCSIALKIVGPRNLLSVCMFSWGAVCLGMGFVQNAGQLYACRLLLGLFEAGLIPCINSYIGMVYLRSEMSMRSAVYYCFSAIAGAFGGLLASAVSNINAGGLPSWSWLFIIEGIITVCAAPLIWWLFPKDPRTAWFLNEEERNVMRLRHELNPHLSNDDEFSWAKVLSAFKDPKTWVHASMEFCVDLSLFSFTTFLPSIIRGLGYTSVQAQLLTVPVYVWATIAYFILAFMSDRAGLRGPFILVACSFLVLGYIVMQATTNLGARYASVFMLAVGVYSTTGMTIVWLNSNFAGHFKRSTALGIVFSIGNTSGVAVGQIFRAQDAPRYLFGVRVNLGMTVLAMVLCCVNMLALRYINKKRQQRLANQTFSATGNLDHEATDYDDTFRYNL
ncbi:high-affinity nicotinic acid transporter [Stachybotrys elegans]|uniref:High-affinity nicotinic acid transporter n=1 Tax=Stachybotrys elegans TaxID=80388 RepID=A0A8K0SXL1_9HYPO|nr:high-affinity nicotinic acid transporter [Stachybotrys elegans]